MPEFGDKSKEKLSKCHPDLQRLFNEVIKRLDCTILAGYKDEEKQKDDFKRGISTKEFPNSKHNELPSKAIDAALWFEKALHVRWEDPFSWYYFGGYVLAVADQLGINIKWGGDWEKNKIFDDSDRISLMHFELDD